MYFSMGHMMWGLPLPKVFDCNANPMGFALCQFILALPIIFIYFKYFVSGYKKLFKGKPNMDSLIAVGATASVLFGVFALFKISYASSSLAAVAMGKISADNVEKYQKIIKTYLKSLYFESCSMILTFVSLGKFLENLSKKKTTNAISKLISLAPDRAIIEVDGKEVEVDAKQVKIGDVVIVKKGASVPVDGEITEGSASFDQSTITGESMPVYKTVGEKVFSSCIVTAGFVKIKATKVGEDTSYANIIKLVEEASASKAPISRLADKISAFFVPIIFCVAIVTFIANFFAQKLALGQGNVTSFEVAFRFAITVIVIACPCALGLATPVAVMVGSGKGAENGLLIKNAEILENARKISTVIMDKTGTITQGKPEVIYFNSKEKEEALSAIYSLEIKSEHPLSQALVEYAKNNGAKEVEVEKFSSIDGIGISGEIGNDFFFIGNLKGLDEKKVQSLIKEFEDLSSQGATYLVVAKNGNVLATVGVLDVIRPDSKEAIENLKKRGIKVVMLTGDNAQTANAIARQVGIDEVISDVLPSDKQRAVAEFKKRGEFVAMVGDGVNDAPSLTGADIGIAIGGGSDVAMDAGDIVLLKKSLMGICSVIDLSKRVLTTIKISLFWAFFYNFICVILASGVFYYLPARIGLRPEYGAIAMSISSVSVVLTSLTINFFKVKKTTSAQKKCDNNCLIGETMTEKFTIKVEGMMCAHCGNRVAKSALEVDGVKSAVASAKDGTLTIEADKNVDKEKIKANIISAGYLVK